MALDTGRRRLGCREAYVGRVDAGDLTFVHCNGRSTHREGERRNLAGTLDERAMRAGEPVASLADAENRAIAAPIVVAGLPFGTIAFVGPRGGEFDADDIDYVRLISSLASASIDRGQQQRRLDALAFYDALTGLPNRVQLADRLTEAIARAQSDAAPFALHFFDLDGFKAINDEHGHPRGDDVIALMGKRFERNVPRPSLVARVGGDEFVVLQPAIRTSEDARAFAQTLRAAIAEPFVVERSEYRISASVGIALYPGDGADAATLLARADLALYKVKAMGRDAVAFAKDLD
jgi:diguanylate cyclase (GGDEF)-like protein